MEPNALPIVFLAAVAVLGTLGWMVVMTLSLYAAGRMPPEARAEVPFWVWGPFGGAVVLSVVWPLGLVASLLAVITGGYWAATHPSSRAAGLASAAVGGAYLALLIALSLGAVAVVGLDGA